MFVPMLLLQDDAFKEEIVSCFAEESDNVVSSTEVLGKCTSR
jgi:hypothetical protein